LSPNWWSESLAAHHQNHSKTSQISSRRKTAAYRDGPGCFLTRSNTLLAVSDNDPQLEPPSNVTRYGILRSLGNRIGSNSYNSYSQSGLTTSGTMLAPSFFVLNFCSSRQSCLRSISQAGGLRPCLP
jgi:hypothetical protein